MQISIQNEHFSYTKLKSGSFFIFQILNLNLSPIRIHGLGLESDLDPWIWLVQAPYWIQIHLLGLESDLDPWIQPYFFRVRNSGIMCGTVPYSVDLPVQYLDRK